MKKWTTVPCENTACAHTHTHSPQRQHSCADAVEIRASLYFFISNRQQQGHTHCAIYLLSQHAQSVEWVNRGAAPALQLQKNPLPSLCLQMWIKLRLEPSDSSLSAVSRDNDVSWHTLIPTQPCYEVMCWTPWPEFLVLFRLLECYKRVYIFHPRNTQARWSSPCARSVEPEANWRAAGKGLQKDEKDTW